MSVETLALRVGLKASTIYDLERGDSKSTTKLAQIAHELGVNALWLETGKGEKYPRGRSNEIAETAPPPYSTDRTFDIPLLEYGGSMGPGGALHEHNGIIENARVNLTLLRQQVTFTSPQNLRILPGYGDSMQPTFADGDPLLVDVGVTDIKVDAVYVLELNDELYIKRLQRRPDGAILMISDNKSYEPYVIQNGDRPKFRVCGRVLLAWNGKRL